MSCSKRTRKINKKKQTIHLRVTHSKIIPGELKNHKKSDFENRIVIEELGSYLGEGAHGTVHSAKIQQIGGGIISYAVKMPANYNDYDKRVEIVNLWYKRIEEMRKIGIKNVVDYAEVIEDKLFLTDLRIYGNVLDFEKNMDLGMISNFDSILEGIAGDMAKIHSNGFILSDNGGTYGFRAWFLLKSKTREGPTGERVICDVGGVERFPSDYIASDFSNKKFIHEIKKAYKQRNLLSLFSLCSFDDTLCLRIYNEYIKSVVKGKHINYANEIFSQLNKDKMEIIDRFNEYALDY